MERVFAVRRTGFFNGQWPSGFLPLAADDGAALIAEMEQQGFFALRPIAEGNPAWKQLIPYCLVTRGPKVLCVRRLAAQSEQRLWGLSSIGIGGHVDPQDGPARGAVLRALRRELGEELVIPALDRRRPRFLGLLNDDATEVGRVHAGLVFQLDVGGDPSAEPDVRIRETEKMMGRFRPVAELRGLGRQPRTTSVASRVVGSPDLWQDRRAFESWSAIMLETSSWAFPEPSGEGSHGDREAHDG